MYQGRAKPKLSSPYFYIKSKPDRRVAAISPIQTLQEKYEKVDDRQKYGENVQDTESDMEGLSKWQDDCMHTTQDDAPHHCSPYIPTSLELCFGGRVQKVDGHLNMEKNSINCDTAHFPWGKLNVMRRHKSGRFTKVVLTFVVHDTLSSWALPQIMIWLLMYLKLIVASSRSPHKVNTSAGFRQSWRSALHFERGKRIPYLDAPSVQMRIDLREPCRTAREKYRYPRSQNFYSVGQA